jgi:parallel beta-helix repeat protein
MKTKILVALLVMLLLSASAGLSSQTAYAAGEPTHYVAASNATADEKAQADYVCDGTSDEDEINSAIAAGYLVKLSEGTFTIDGAITKAADNVVIEGQEQDVTTIKLKAATAINSMIEIGGDGWQIKNLTIDGDRDNAANDWNFAVGINNKDNGLISNVHFKDFGTTLSDRQNPCIYFYTAASNTWTIENCRFTDCPGNGIATYNVVTNNIKILNNYFYNMGYNPNAYAPIGPWGNSGSYDWLIDGNTFEDCAYASIYIKSTNSAHPCYNMQVTNNHTEGNNEAEDYKFYHAHDCVFANNTSRNVASRNGQGLLGMWGDCYNITISNNVSFNANQEGIATYAADGLYPHDCTIVGNTFTGGQADSSVIYLNNPKNFTVSNNTIRNGHGSGWGAGIRADVSQDCTFNGNSIIDDRGTPITAVGIELYNGCQGCAVDGNIIQGTTDYGVLLYNADDCTVSNNNTNNTYIGIEVTDGDDVLIQGNRIQTTTPIDVNNANVVRPVITDNNWQGSGNDASYAAAIDPFFANNINKDGVQWIISTPPVNQPPALSPIGNKAASEGKLLQFTIYATDPDGDALTYLVSNLPQGTSFNPNAGTFSWTPVEAGIYPNVHFEVSDGSLTDSEDITITVISFNLSPILNPIGDKLVSVGELLQFTIYATDPHDGNLTHSEFISADDPHDASLIYSASNLPPGASFDPQTGTFSWIPDEAGIYPNVHFEVSDGSLTDSEDITIIVSSASQSSEPNPIDESLTHSEFLSATDPGGEWQKCQREIWLVTWL